MEGGVTRAQLEHVSSERRVIIYTRRAGAEVELCVLDGDTFLHFPLDVDNMMRLNAEMSHEVLRAAQLARIKTDNQ